MKKFFVQEKGVSSSPYNPFWNPWGGAGCLGRALSFILALLVFLVLLWLLSRVWSCENRPVHPDIPINQDSIYTPADTTSQFIDSLSQELPIEVENPVPELPKGDDNRFKPINDDDIVDNPNGPGQIANNLVNVILDSDAGDDVFNRFAQEFKALYPQDDYRIVRYSTLTKLIQIKVPSSQREALIKNLPSQITDIKFKIFPEEIFSMNEARVPSDPAFKYAELNWYFSPIQAYDAWGITMGSDEITVAIVDSYFDLNHDELKGKFRDPYSLENGTRNVFPPANTPIVIAGHGSHVTSTAVGNVNNKSGLCGIAPLCSFMPVSMGAQLTSGKILEGLLYAIYQGADVVNLSVGSKFSTEDAAIPIDQQVIRAKTTNLLSQDVWDFAFDLANKHNCTIVWSAGNDNILAGLDESKRNNTTIRVSAVDHDLKKASFSNFGNIKEKGVAYSTISSPGVDIFSALPNNTYDSWGGTSMAAPIITGTVALMKSINASLSNEEIINILKSTGKPVKGDNTIGNLVQIKDALTKVKEGLLNFDDISKNPQKLLGIWEATCLLNIVYNGKLTGDKTRIYLTFESSTQGTITLHDISSDYYFIAPITIKMSPQKIEITEQYEPRSKQSNLTYKEATITCKPGKDRLLNCVYKSDKDKDDNRDSVAEFNLRKVDKIK